MGPLAGIQGEPIIRDDVSSPLRLGQRRQLDDWHRSQSQLACGQDAPVAGYDAVVLKATDAQALRDWLEKHGYDARPAVTTWLEPYIKDGWIITAFSTPADSLLRGGRELLLY